MLQKDQKLSTARIVIIKKFTDNIYSMDYLSKDVYEFIAQQMNDPIIERKTCEASGQPFAIFQSDKDFYKKVAPMINGKKMSMPLPRLCPEERQRRRLCLRNERKLYRRQCDFSGKNMISTYSPDKQYKVYQQDIWESDKRDGLAR
ncbi:MAG: hypothetical protein WCG98_05335 [bacterium]